MVAMLLWLLMMVVIPHWPSDGAALNETEAH